MADQSTQYVFLVDDEPIQNEMLKDHISSKFQYMLKTYSNGEDAIKDMNLQPAIVVLDFHLSSNMPNAQNGVEVLVPQFVKTGDVIRLDLAGLKYMDRVRRNSVG